MIHTRFAWVTLVTNDSYSLGALVLAHALKRVRTKHDLAVLITPGVTAAMREKLTAVFSLVKEVNVLDSQDEANLALLARPELGITFTKLHCWRLTQYEKCVFVDADTLVIRNCDELFEREELSAAPDVGWPDCFNSGVFVFKPSQQTFASLTAFATSKGSFDGGDQGLLNLYFSDWAHKDISKHLPFIYNMCSTASYSYLPAYKQFGSEIRIIHFIGSTKPWLQYFDTQTSLVHPSSDSQHLQSLLQLWWNIFCEDVHPQLSPVMITSTLARREHNLYVSISPPSRNTISSRSIHHEYHTPTDSTYDKVDKIFDTGFYEFKDPWDSYIEPTVANNSNYSLNHPSDINVNTNSNDSVFVCEQNHEEFDKESTEIPLKNRTNFPDSMDRLCDTVEISNNNNYNNNNSNNENTSIENNYTIDIKNFNCYQIIDEILRTDNFDKKTDLSIINDNEQVQLAINNSNNSSPDQTKCNINFNREDQSNFVDKTENLVFLPTEDNKFNGHDHAYKNSVNSKPLPEPYAECKNNENESQIHCTVEVESKCAGIAGALAKITLGEARSPEQVALEEHMRRQSWEQGQIDYMGRDSFDNIWKKICTTLSIVPETQESTPKETIVADVKEKVSKPPIRKTPSTEDEPAKEVSQDVAGECHLKKSPEESKKSSEKSIQEISSPAVETSQAPNKNEPILSVTSGAPQLCIKESGETSRQPSKQEQEEKLAIALGFTTTPKDSKDKPEVKLDVSPKKSSVRTVADSPVPIQVAESVLEADIKESVSEDIKPVTEEAISSISAPIQESISTVVETPLEPPPPAQSPSVEASPLMQPNGNGLDIGLHFINAPPRAITPVSAPEPTPVRRQASIPETESKKPTGTCSRSLVGTSSSEKTEAIESESCQLTSKVSLAENVVPEQVPKTTEEVAPEPKVEEAETVIETKHSEDPQTSAIVPEEPAAKEQQRPLPKELVIPGTPTIIEATPPTSPPLDVAGCLPEPVKPEKEKPEKKVIRKIVKKSSEEKSEESEAGEAKKITKKVVKKVVKKVKDADDTGESSTAGEKPKKVVKVIKKTTKVQNLDAEASVPDTPPPASSQTPVPPKRKIKPATAKSSKKTEQDPAATP
ncbi:Similar to GYG1: Glycogenin-1 (Oryctolagus cuniculus) [Cotesia congregata]|uniref:glycogenin glucosyltransferase n=1 Tax=Cotesia congregata TaxID=51543 RepID=A0A8J2HI27_COTCN|nr:Similar to GYG1: Glycogenin-1 (Oryctolagus cuniculus) [Cotesia congregata]